MPAPVSSTPKPFNRLPKRKREFVKAYVRSGDAKVAYRAAGYKEGRSMLSRCSALMRELTPYLAQAHKDYLEGVEMAILGSRVVAELATGADNETVRLNAAKELLSRAAPEDAKETTVNHVHKTLTNAQVDDRIRELQDQLFLNAPKAQVVVPIK